MSFRSYYYAAFILIATLSMFGGGAAQSIPTARPPAPHIIATIPVGAGVIWVAVNPVTNRIYVTNQLETPSQ